MISLEYRFVLQRRLLILPDQPELFGRELPDAGLAPSSELAADALPGIEVGWWPAATTAAALCLEDGTYHLARSLCRGPYGRRQSR